MSRKAEKQWVSWWKQKHNLEFFSQFYVFVAALGVEGKLNSIHCWFGIKLSSSLSDQT